MQPLLTFDNLSHSEPAPSVTPEVPSSLSWREKVGTWLRRPPLWLTLLACGAILVARRIADVRNPQFWAEDGVIFFYQAWTMGWSALFEPYAGYLSTLQRLVAGVATYFDPREAPTLYMASAGLVTLYTAARTQSSRFPLPPHVGYALAVVLVPDAYEVLLFLVNIQWVTGPALLLLLISTDARRWWQHLHDGLAAAVFGLTGPFSILFAPLFLWRAWHRRTWASSLLCGLILLSAAVQAWTLWRNPVAMNESAIVYQAAPAVPGARLAASLLIGHWLKGNMTIALGCALSVLTVAGLYGLARREGNDRVERIWLVVALALVMVASIHRCRFVLVNLLQQSFGARYFFGPQMIILWLLVATLADSRRWLARGGTALLLWMLAANLPRLREPALHDFQWREQAAPLTRGEAATIPVNPPGWSIPLPARAP